MTTGDTAAGRRPAVAMVMEQTLGHVTHFQNLSAIMGEDPRIEATFLPVPFDKSPKFWWVPFYDNWTVRGGHRVRKLLRGVAVRDRYDVLFVHTQALATLLNKRAVRRPTVISLDATPVQYDELGVYYVHRRNGRLLEWAKKQINQRQLRSCAGVVSWSEWAKRSLVADYLVDPANVVVIPPGVDFEVWQRAAARAPRSTHLKVLFVGGDLRRKGGSDLLAAFAAARSRLAASDPSIELELVLVTGARIDPQPGVTVRKGLQPNSAELVACYHDADIFCLPTHGDCLPMVLSEAAACGLPVISTRVGAIDEIVVHEETGLLINVGDVSSLTEALCRLATDAELRRSMGAAGRERVAAHFDARRNAAKLADLFITIEARQAVR